jgi:chromosome segregation protein
VTESEEESMKREMSEAGMVAGRDAIYFEETVFVPEVRSVQSDRLKSIEKLKYRIEDASIGNSSDILREYEETSQRDSYLEKEMTDLQKGETELRKIIADLDLRIDFEFKEGIKKINFEFDHLFKVMFGGGHAGLNIVREVIRKKKVSDTEISEEMFETDPNEETEEGTREGLEVDVSLPTKKVKGLMMLSGGERALTSIALLFAISQVNPPPFIILDETDAALDESNSRKYGDMIENLSKKSELIIITHNRETMSRAGALYGVTMNSDGASRLLSIIFDEAVRVAK